jgi:16S rRNA (guanine527-N7)-methyltransferase
MTTPGAALPGGGASPLEEARLNRQREPLPTDVASLPALPATYERELDTALGVLAIDIGPSARAAIDGHVRLLLAWNVAINLTAIAEPAEVARRHVADSLAALDVIRAGLHATLLDLGSGGGFPGLPLGAVLPATRVLLVESVAKKAAFLDATCRAVGLDDRVSVVASRAEALAPAGARIGWDVVTARAVGALGDLVELALPLLAAGGRLVAWKRGDLAAELEAARRATAALGAAEPQLHPLPEALGLTGHVLVVVRKEAPTPAGYPRDPAARKRRPW